MKEEIKEDIKNIFLILLTPIICLIIGWCFQLFSENEISIMIVDLFITIFLNLAFVFFIKYVLKKKFQKPEGICFLWSLLLLIIATINNGNLVNGGAFVFWYYINCDMLKIKENKKVYSDNEDELGETDRYINQFATIECKVCGKQIPYNENGTCEECHRTIMERIEAKKTNPEYISKLNIVNNANISQLQKDRIIKEINLMSEKDITDVISKLQNKNEETKQEDMEEQPIQKFCVNCGKPLQEDWKFCNFCGHKLK